MSDLTIFREKMDKSIDSLASEYTTIRAGRANPHVLDHITVDYYGTPSNLQAVANISVPEARTIMIQPWEASLIKDIEKAILISDLGLTPNNDSLKKQQKANEISEDELKTAETDVQKMTDEFIKKIDVMIEDKSKEIMTV